MLRRTEDNRPIIVEDKEAAEMLEAVVAKGYNRNEIVSYLDEVVCVRQFRDTQVLQMIEILSKNPDMQARVVDGLYATKAD